MACRPTPVGEEKDMWVVRILRDPPIMNSATKARPQLGEGPHQKQSFALVLMADLVMEYSRERFPVNGLRAIDRFGVRGCADLPT